MLKAIWLDEVEQAAVIKYVVEYKDTNGILNSSEALKKLLKLGFESLSYEPLDDDLSVNEIKLVTEEVKASNINKTQRVEFESINKMSNPERQDPPQQDLYKIIELLLKQQEIFLNSNRTMERTNESNSNELMLRLMATLIDKVPINQPIPNVNVNSTPKRRLTINKRTTKIKPIQQPNEQSIKPIDNFNLNNNSTVIDFKQNDSKIRGPVDRLPQSIDDKSTLLQNILNNSNR